MLSDIDISARTRRAILAATALAVCCIAGCSTAVTQPMRQVETAPIAVALQSAPVAVSPPQPASDILTPVLAYADRIRTLAGNELAQEITRLGDAPTPDDQMRLAIALIQTRQLYDLVRGQDLLQRVLANGSPEARALHPLARLLAARYAEQRRIEDQLDRQSQQLREAQRRLDQTNDKLEALKEIERSLTPRPVTPAPAATRNRARTATQ
jgi:hypothetical protein